MNDILNQSVRTNWKQRILASLPPAYTVLLTLKVLDRIPLSCIYTLVVEKKSPILFYIITIHITDSSYDDGILMRKAQLMLSEI